MFLHKCVSLLHGDESLHLFKNETYISALTNTMEITNYFWFRNQSSWKESVCYHCEGVLLSISLSVSYFWLTKSLYESSCDTHCFSVTHCRRDSQTSIIISVDRLYLFEYLFGALELSKPCYFHLQCDLNAPDSEWNANMYSLPAWHHLSVFSANTVCILT